MNRDLMSDEMKQWEVKYFMLVIMSSDAFEYEANRQIMMKAMSLISLNMMEVKK
jgi:hypothetical protein